MAAGKAPYDIYIIWCSTNDIWGNPIGTSSDYTGDDGFDERKLATQCGGLNYCIKTIQQHAPSAKILLFASLKSFTDSYGYSRTGLSKYNPPRRMCDYVDAQTECAERFSVPVLNLWAESGINEYNFKELFPKSIRRCPIFIIHLHTVWMFTMFEELLMHSVPRQEMESILHDYILFEIQGWRAIIKI